MSRPTATREKPPRLEIAFATDTGRVRQSNQDAILCEPPDSPFAQARGILCIVADGMGGYAGGEIASELGAQTTRDSYYQSRERDPAVALRAAVEAAHGAVAARAFADPALRDMGTTLTAALIHGRTYTIAQVGDSRAYLVQGSTARRLTRDDSYVQELVDSKVIDEAEAGSHPRANELTQALGHGPSPSVQIRQGVLRDGESLVLCCDGLYRMVPDAEVARVVQTLAASAAAQDLVDQANRAGGVDNISVLIVQVEPDARKTGGVTFADRLRSRQLPIVAAVASAAILVGVILFARPPTDITNASVPTGASGAPVVEEANSAVGSGATGSLGQTEPSGATGASGAATSVPSVPSPPPIATAQNCIVQEGEGFTQIAKRVYQDADLYVLIEKANPQKDSNSLQPGDTLLCPAPPPAALPPAVRAN